MAWCNMAGAASDCGVRPEFALRFRACGMLCPVLMLGASRPGSSSRPTLAASTSLTDSDASRWLRHASAPGVGLGVVRTQVRET
eukprot:2243604-Rhodomonas_salina.1